MEMVLRYAAMMLVLFSTMVASQLKEENDRLRIGFYERSCPNAEGIIQQTIKEEVDRHPGISAGFIRLFFHDCFVRGCDASVLLNTTMGPEVEMTAGGNIGLRGFTAIDVAKALLEKECPNTVSCADIIAFAARDAAVLANFPYYTVPAGRRDGTISNASEVYGNLPAPFSRNVSAMTSIFEKKGLTTLDLVALLGAHSMGRLHCKIIIDQLNGNVSKADADMTPEALGMDPRYFEHLKQRCPPNHHAEAVVSLNPSPMPLNRILSNSYYDNVIKAKAALMSDQALMSDPVTKDLVIQMARDLNLWKDKFRTSMLRLGNVDVLTGSQGEIRKYCGIVNK